MTDKTKDYQGKKARCLFNYKATMTDELNIKTDDIIVLIQCSEDETWFEGTLNGLTGWFPSNYVQILEEISEIKNSESSESFSIDDEKSRNKYIHELKLIEENFLDEICKFVKIAILPLKTNDEIFSATFVNNFSSSLDDVIRCHQLFYQQLKELPEDVNTKIGNFMINFAPQFKKVYENYAKNNPKYSHQINKKKDILGKYFELSLPKMTSSLLTTTSTITVAIYFTKFLTAPFKQLEIYIKFLKEIQRYTKDSHVDRGDVQRSIELYTELANTILEIRKMREYELDIMSSKINNLDENLFKKSESLYLSQAVIVTETGEIKDRILILVSNHLVVLSPTKNSNEFDFENRIFFINQENKTLSQIRKITNIDTLKNVYGPNFDSSNFVNKYCFELNDITIQNKENFGKVGKLFVMCFTSYDLKNWIELITDIINKTQAGFSFCSLKKSSSDSRQKSENSKSFKSPNTVKPKNKKIFCIRPHAPLIPHFQLPNDNQCLNNQDTSSTIKRFMYKKPKSSDAGKYHGADDDLKLLNVIDSLTKVKKRQGSTINSNIITANLNEKSNQATKLKNSVKTIENFNESINSTSTMNEKSIAGYTNQLLEEKNKLESQLNLVNSELNELKKANKELKTILNSYQKNLENERQARKKLENFYLKHAKQIQQMSSEKMLSISNLLRFNSINNEKLNFEKMNLDELKNHEKKYLGIKSNTKLINSLKDKGQKIDENLKIIQELKEKLENEKSEYKETHQDLDSLVDKMETLEFDKAKNTEIEEQTVNKENYFFKISTKSERKSEKNIDTGKLNQIKAKIKENMDKQSKYKESKEIPVDEAFKLLKEHEKRIQEYQMKQAAERLLMGQSVKYEFSFLEKTEKKNLIYRDRDYDDENDDDYSNEENESETDQFYEEENFSGSSIDKIHNSEKLKSKQYSDELENVD